MTVGAADTVRRMNSALPVSRTFVLGMAGQTCAVRISGGTLLESKDLGSVSSTVYVQTSVTMTIFTLDPLLGVVRMLEILCDICVAGGAGFGSNPLRPWNPDGFTERRNLPCSLLC
jgi:hypothetical protein